MKVNRLETHDRLLEFGKQSDYISRGCQDCIANRPKEYQDYPFYIFAHKRTIEMDERISIFNEDLWHFRISPNYNRRYMSLQDVPTHRMIWEPRLTKPKSQTNSMLFKAYPPGDNIKIIWIIPERELWEQYTKGNMTEHGIVVESINLFQKNKEELEKKEQDDLPDQKIVQIMSEIGRNARARKEIKPNS